MRVVIEGLTVLSLLPAATVARGDGALEFADTNASFSMGSFIVNSIMKPGQEGVITHYVDGPGVRWFQTTFPGEASNFSTQFPGPDCIAPDWALVKHDAYDADHELSPVSAAEAVQFTCEGPS